MWQHPDRYANYDGLDVHKKLHGIGKHDELNLTSFQRPHLRITGWVIGKELDSASAGVSVCAASINV